MDRDPPGSAGGAPPDTAGVGPATGSGRLHARVDAALHRFLGGQAAALRSVGEELAPVAQAAAGFAARGGKRLRPAFCYWGWRAGGGPDCPEVVAAAASLELLHAGALVHDDLMDRSDTRRGAPSVHRRFAELHHRRGWRGGSERFGAAAATLVGDLCLIWADAMFTDCGLPEAALRRARPVFDRMRVELMAGQYLDVLEQARGDASLAGAMRVAQFKTARYTVERPLLLGGSLAGAPRPVLDCLSRYGLPLGEAFQLRDDVLGVFGQPAQTGKPAGDDLREGKRSTLVAAAVGRADPRQRELLSRWLGDPQLDEARVADLARLIRATGALAEVERLIDQRTSAALRVLDDSPLAADSRDALRELAAAATSRNG